MASLGFYFGFGVAACGAAKGHIHSTHIPKRLVGRAFDLAPTAHCAAWADRQLWRAANAGLQHCNAMLQLRHLARRCYHLLPLGQLFQRFQ